MDALKWILQFAYFLMGITASLPHSSLLPNSQRYASLRVNENKNHSISQSLLQDDVGEYGPKQQIRKDTTSIYLPVGNRRESHEQDWGENASLSLLLNTIVRHELDDCDLVLACNAAFCGSTVQQILPMLPNVRQVGGKVDIFKPRC